MKMNFNYPLRTIFKHDITKIRNNLIPDEFTTEDRRTFRVSSEEKSDIVSTILDEMGKAAAKAQDLQEPITSWDKLKNSDYTVYLLVDREEDIGGDGRVLGFLKVGRKNLYVFNLDGECHERNTLCLLDFYVHESVQRKGLGKKLFEYMLEDENISPDKLAIDRPSHKALLFLQKHYGLSDVVSQSNNFVVFTGYFNNARQNYRDFITKIPSNQEHNHSPALSLATSHYSTGANRNDYQNSGRHTAFKSEDTMGQIVQSTAVRHAK